MFPKLSTPSMVARTTPSPYLRLRQLEPHELLRVDRRAEVAERDAAREVRGGRGEEVAAVERARDVLERVAGFASSCASATPPRVGGGHEQAVVRADVEPSLGVTERERAATAADSRIDDGEVHADRHVRERVGEHERALQDAAWAGSRA